ncbi:hypothetical protein [Brevundimonas vesicularis]|uniref:Uncharacterized protein n=1 Tax=Brevundimonas vesicularis TaxID=41276 RepID=A0ABU4KNX0_BREVE|nr:hypothetical protein [Brevundimonas vesicularis]MDX2334637.1 hypothetical protein [Brevundimonas vesicularis]
MLPISTWVDEGIGLDVFCQCGRTGYVAAEAARKLDTSMSLALVAHHLVCTGCGAKGRALQVRFSIGNYYDQARDRGSLIPGGDSKTPPA